MDDFTATMIDLLESSRRTAIALLESSDVAPERRVELEAEIAECEAELAELRND